MPIVKPFAALRPVAEKAGRICELPYDVLSAAEAAVLAANNPLSFFHVSKPEIDLPSDVDHYDPRVYAKGRENFDRLRANGFLIQDEEPGFYLYRQVMGQHIQLGLVAVTSCEEYRQGLIKKHELTRPDKEDDRVRHIESLNAQTGPAFLTYRADSVLDECFQRQIERRAEVDFVAGDGIRHTSWSIRDRDTQELIEQRFASIGALYIADGHHRTAAAARLSAARQGRGQSDYFLSVIFPHKQVQILPYHRVLKDLNGLTPAELGKRLQSAGLVLQPGTSQPKSRHEIGLYLNDQWSTLRFQPELTANRLAIENLDVSLLQKHVLSPIFGIDDPRTSQRINFVGGIRGAAELERLVRSGEYACAFSLFPTGIDELMSIAEAGGLMPPKSTWFEPKLRDGMFCHLLD